MANLTRAHYELFQRSPDERLSSLDELWEHCRQVKAFSNDCWHLPHTLQPQPSDGAVRVTLGDDGAFLLNSWSFSQLCRLSGVNRATVNRLSPETASRALQETLPVAEKPIQLLTTGRSVRSLHGVTYTRLWNADLLSVVREYATDFQPPQTGALHGRRILTGLLTQLPVTQSCASQMHARRSTIQRTTLRSMARGGPMKPATGTHHAWRGTQIRASS